MESADLEAILQQVRAYIGSGDPSAAAALLEPLHPADRADVFEALEPDEQDALVDVLDTASTADIFEDLDEAEAVEAAMRLESEELAPIVDEMEPDEAADLLGDMPADRAAEVLASMEDPEEVRPLLLHPDETAGGLMTSEFVVLRPLMRTADAIEAIRQWSPVRQDIFHYYVADREGHLCGVVNLLNLVHASPHERVRAIMDGDVISVTVGAEQEECARIMSHYDLIALPVVDHDNHVVGVITVDDVVEVLEEEATEDIQRLGGTVPLGAPYLDLSPLVVARKRVFWLFVLFLTQTLTASVINLFEAQLQAAIVLSLFIPLLIGTGGNAGSQSVATIIRALSIGDLTPNDFLRTLWHEARVGVILGVAMAVVGFVRALTWAGPDISLAVGVSLLAVVLWANCVGAVLPMLAARLRVDPTIISGPMLSTLVDATGLLIYFSIARAILGL